MISKKIILGIVLYCVALQGDIIRDKVVSITGQENYQSHKDIIDEALINKDLFSKEKALLNTSLSEQTDINICFNIINSNKIGFKIIKDILSNIGYAYYFTDQFKNDSQYLTWRIHFKSDFALDPSIFSEKLSKYNVKITNVNKLTQTNWEYEIDMKNGLLYNTRILVLGERLTLPMPLEPYILSIPNAKELLIASSNANNWVPKISFYDKELNILGTIEMDRVHEGIKVVIPKNAKYTKISDKWSLLNIKRGLSILASNSL